MALWQSVKRARHLPSLESQYQFLGKAVWGEKEEWGPRDFRSGFKGLKGDGGRHSGSVLITNQ